MLLRCFSAWEIGELHKIDNIIKEKRLVYIYIYIEATSQDISQKVWSQMGCPNNANYTSKVVVKWEESQGVIQTLISFH